MKNKKAKPERPHYSRIHLHRNPHEADKALRDFTGEVADLAEKYKIQSCLIKAAALSRPPKRKNDGRTITISERVLMPGMTTQIGCEPFDRVPDRALIKKLRSKQ